MTCVKHRDRDGVCAGACGNAVSNEVSKPCLRKRKASDSAECPATKKHRERYCNDPDYRQNKINYAKTKYCSDRNYREKKMNIRIEIFHEEFPFVKV